MKIPYLIPSMPTAYDLLPYLRRIDESHRYSNDGPLVRELEQKLCELVGAPAGVCVASCTAGLTAAALYLGREQGVSACAPVNTFAGTWQALERADYRIAPRESSGWFMAAPEKRFDLVVPVCTFGMPFDVSHFHETSAVLIDAAAAIYTQRASEFLTVYSLHATKLLSSGEGGFIACRNAAEEVSLRAIINFGVESGGSRMRLFEYGFNGKMSEYHAAVGLASLRRHSLNQTTHFIHWHMYQRNLAALESTLPPAYGSGLNFPLRLPVSCDERNALDHFRAHGIEVRYGYAPFVRPSPEEKRFLCLPCYPLMSAAQVDEVSDVALQFAGGAV